SQGSLCSLDVAFQSFSRLPHRLIQVGQADLDTQIVRFCQKQLLQKRNRFRLLAIFQVEFRQLQEQRPGLAHHALLHVQIGKLLEWTHFLWREFRDSLVNRDRFGQESVADEELRQPLKIFDGLKGFALADVQLADG